MKYLGISLLFLISTLAASAARADDADAFSKNGAYFGIGASYGVPLFEPTIDNAFNGAGLNEKVSNAWGLNARAGYRFHKFLAAEVEYEWLNHFGTRVEGISLGSIRAQTITANLKAIAPYGHWQPYVLAGLGLIRPHVSTVSLSADKNAFGYDVGGGVTLSVLPHVGIRGDLRHLHTMEDVNVLLFSGQHLNFWRGSAGVALKF
jgi:opacity protein-like surface antigen